MPRKPSNLNPVRLLREALKKTQDRFAAFLGISRKYLQKIELGDRPLPQDLADLLMAAFGVAKNSISRRSGKPFHLLEDPQHRDLEANVRLWQVFTAKLDDWSIEELRSYFLPKLEVLFKAAARKRSTAGSTYPRAMALGLRLDRWIEDASNQYKLKTSIEDILAAHSQAGKPVTWAPSFAIASGNNTMFLPGSSKILLRLKRAEKSTRLKKPAQV